MAQQQRKGSAASKLLKGILAARDLDFEQVEVPEWDACPVVIITELTALDENELAVEIETAVAAGENPHVNYKARTLVRALRDPDWNLIFDPTDPEHAKALGRKSPKILTKLYQIVSDLSGLDEEEGADGGPGNSGAGLSDDSPTD